MRKLLFCIFFASSALISKGQSNTKVEEIPYKLFSSYSPFTLMNAVRGTGKAGNRILTVMGKFSSKSVSLADVKKLIHKIKDEDQCACLLSPLSSNLPKQNETANLGGYAILLINAYRTKSDISPGLYRCPKTSQKDVSEILNWWHEAKDTLK